MADVWRFSDCCYQLSIHSLLMETELGVPNWIYIVGFCVFGLVWNLRIWMEALDVNLVMFNS